MNGRSNIMVLLLFTVFVVGLLCLSSYAHRRINASSFRPLVMGTCGYNSISNK